MPNPFEQIRETDSETVELYQNGGFFTDGEVTKHVNFHGGDKTRGEDKTKDVDESFEEDEVHDEDIDVNVEPDHDDIQTFDKVVLPLLAKSTTSDGRPFIEIIVRSIMALSVWATLLRQFCFLVLPKLRRQDYIVASISIKLESSTQPYTSGT